MGLNFEQELGAELGTFLRIGLNDGATETWAFTEIDETVSLGLSFKGSTWKRPQDTLGVAGIINGISHDHLQYLSDGGYGFIIGDGKLNYSPEEIFEVYYRWQVIRVLAVSGDYQFVHHPAYNADRGPVSILGLRLHCAI